MDKKISQYHRKIVSRLPKGRRKKTEASDSLKKKDHVALVRLKAEKDKSQGGEQGERSLSLRRSRHKHQSVGKG